MENPSWSESFPVSRIKAIQELTGNQMLANKLHEMLRRPEDMESDIKSDNGVVVQISEVFNKTLSILSSTNVNGVLHYPTNGVRSLRTSDYQKSKDSEKNNNTMISVKTKRGCYKRRYSFILNHILRSIHL